MLRPKIEVIVDSKTTPPTTTAECVKCALCAEYHLNEKIKKRKASLVRAKSLRTTTITRTVETSEIKTNLKEVSGAITRGRGTFPIRGAIIIVKEEGHLSKDCPNKMYQSFQQRQQKIPPTQLHSMQAALDGPHISHRLLEAPSITTNARIFTMTKEEAIAETSTVVTGHILVNNQYANVLLEREPLTPLSLLLLLKD
ncbi:hypothetical protein TIFTF001_033845 [Ficus carica]|uniref:Uncharacterized protein n=1 Tax=Ficus carica TaxID=3494 RepID=A0AA88J7Q1_FICCA|nr:hypothetical protein TIFTF001_033845 [Ficus carica]